MVDEIKNAVIAQINMSYIKPEDRVALRIGMSNQTELVVWVTRRVAKHMWQLLSESTAQAESIVDAASPQAEKLKQSFAKESAAQQLDYTGQYEARSALNADENFLVQECSLSVAENGIENLHMLCTNNQTLNIALNEDLSFALINMLQLVTKEAEWDFAFSGQSSVLTSAVTSKALH